MARTWWLECAGCGESFEAKSPGAKWCSPGCKKRKQRDPDGEPGRVEVPEGERFFADSHQLVISVKAELEQADRLETWKGQHALQVARRLADPDESGVGSLSRELSRVMAEALGEKAPVAGGVSVNDQVDEDEITRARREREEARQAAGLA